MLHGYRQFYNLCKFRRSLCRPCPRYWEKIWQIKLWSWQTTIHRQETKKWSGLWRWIGGKIIKEIVALRPNTYSFLTIVDWKANSTKKCVIKQEIKFHDYKACLENKKTILRSQRRLKSKAHNVFTKKVYKIALSATKRSDGGKTYPYG